MEVIIIDIVDRIFELVAQQFKEQKDFAAALDVPAPRVSEWRRRKSNSYQRCLPEIAQVLNTSTEYLLTGTGPKTKKAPASAGKWIPVLGDVAAGVPIEAIVDIVDYEEIGAALAATGDFFGLRIRGSSMEPRMQEGDVVIVRKQDDAETGQIAVVTVNGDSATVKKIKKLPDGIQLIPTNPAHDPFYYTAAEVESLPVRIIGRVVELRAKF